MDSFEPLFDACQMFSLKFQAPSYDPATVYTFTLTDAVTVEEAYNSGAASAIGLQGHVVWCSGR